MQKYRITLAISLPLVLLFYSLLFGPFLSWHPEKKYPAVDLEDQQVFRQSVEQLWRKTLEFRLIGQVLVKREGQVLFQGASGGDTLDTPTLIGSVSKQFTGEKILELVRRKKIRLEDSLCQHLPDYCHGDLKTITIHHLMTHTSGLPLIANGNIFTGIVTDNLFHKPLDQLTKPIAMEPLGFTPGTQFDYSNLGFDLLARIIEVVERKPVAEVMKEFFTHHGLENTFLKEVASVPSLASGVNLRFFGGPRILKFWIPGNVSSFENFAGSGATVSTANDLSQWLEKLRLSKESEKSLQHIPQMKYAKDVSKDNPYFGGWVVNTKKKIVWHNGYVFGYKSGVFSYPETGITAVFLFNNSTFSKDEQKVINAWQDLFLGHEYVLPD